MHEAQQFPSRFVVMPFFSSRFANCAPFEFSFGVASSLVAFGIACAISLSGANSLASSSELELSDDNSESLGSIIKSENDIFESESTLSSI